MFLNHRGNKKFNSRFKNGMTVMTNENNKEQTFDAVKYMRQQREELTKKLSKMTREESLSISSV